MFEYVLTGSEEQDDSPLGVSLGQHPADSLLDRQPYLVKVDETVIRHEVVALEGIPLELLESALHVVLLGP